MTTERPSDRSSIFEPHDRYASGCDRAEYQCELCSTDVDLAPFADLRWSNLSPTNAAASFVDEPEVINSTSVVATSQHEVILPFAGYGPSYASHVAASCSTPAMNPASKSATES
jgi:hypothetical protein